MSDRPDWLPEPVRPSGPPLSERLHVGAASVASLLLGVLGTVMLGTALFMTIAGFTGFNRHVDFRVVVSYVVPGLFMTTLAYLLRWCLRRVRPQVYKPRPPA